MKLKKLGKIFYKAGYHTVDDDGVEHAGYLAFLGLLSIFPFVVFIFSFAASIGRQEIWAEFIAEFLKLFPEDIALTFTPRINEILSGPPQGLLTIAIIGVIWTASSAVEGLRTILNKIYKVTSPPIYVVRRLMSMGQFIVLAFAVVVAMFFLTFAPTIYEYIEELTPFKINIEPNWLIARYLISAFILFISVATSYYVLPNIKQKWREVVPGSFIVVISWIGFAYLFSSYISYYKQFSIVYGSLAGIILTLLFFYVLGVIYIFGAEFNYFYEKSKGKRIIEKEPEQPTMFDEKLLPKITKATTKEIKKVKKKKKPVRRKK